MQNLRVLCRRIVAGLLAGLLVSAACAGTATGLFNVNITLTPRDVCVSSVLSAQTNATVRVVCGTEQFVSIESLPGKPFVGTHGGAYRFVFAPGTIIPSILLGESDMNFGAGTITALRVLNLNAHQDRLELLVSF
jgi:hypothetical protein